MATDDWIGALRIANRFARLGKQKEAITRAWAAHTNPNFYRQIGKDPDAMLDAGIVALKSRYSNKVI